MMLWTALGFGLIACIASLLLTPLSILISHRLSLLDQPDARKVHTNAIPRLGGIGIIGATFFVAVPAFLYLWSLEPNLEYDISRQYMAILLGGLCIFAVGLVDDLSPISSRFKLVALLASSFAICGAGGAFTDFRTIDASLVNLPWLSWGITALWIAGIAVAFNFIDGLDGLSGGLGLLASAVLSFFLLSTGQYAAAVAPLALAGGILGFLYFNWHPAKTFMGDGGSMTIGYLLGAISVVSNPSLGTMRSMVLPGLALSVALVDCALTLFRRRYQQRRSIFSAERGHIHHRLLDTGFSHKQAVYVIHFVSLVCVAIGFASLSFDSLATFGGLLLVVPVLWGLFHIAGSVRTNEMVTALRRKRDLDKKSRRFKQEFETLQLEFDAASNFSEWWRVVCNAADRLEFSRLDLPVTSPQDLKPRTLSWQSPEDRFEVETDQIDAKIPVTVYGDAEPSRTATVQIPATVCLESAGQRLALFSRLMSENGQRSLRKIHFKIPKKSKEPLPPAAGEFGHLRIALVHDFFYTYAGAERVVEQIVNAFPHCDVFGLFDFLPEEKRDFLKNKPVTTTFIQKMPFANKKHRTYLPLMPLAIEQLDVSDYDIVISSSYLVAKGVITGPDQLHICYCHSPVRYGWDLQHQYLNEAKLGYGLRGMLARGILHYIRNWDARSSLGVDHFIANSKFVARRIEKVYRRKAEVIYPPVDTLNFTLASKGEEAKRGDYYLTASRLVSYKRIDLIVEAFTRTPERKLVVIGDGPEMGYLRQIAGPNVELLGQQDQSTLVSHMQHAKAFVFAAEEDFGIVPVEAMACGTPVIAYGKGGVTESVKDGQTGYFFPSQTCESLIGTLNNFEALSPAEELDRNVIRQRAERFSTEQFIERLSDSLRQEVRERWPERLLEAKRTADNKAAITKQNATQQEDDVNSIEMGLTSK